MRESKFDFGGYKLRWKQLVFSLGLAGLLALLSSCGSNSSSSTATPSIVVSCTSTQVIVLGTSQCTATVSNLSSTLVNWSISPTTGTGSITNNNNVGDYTAPATVPTNNVVTVTAASQVQTTVTATATITIEPAVAIAAITCVDPITQIQTLPLVVSSGNNLDCSATATGGAAVSVNWTVSNTNNLGGDIGSIALTGVYKAPLVPPPGQSVTITATSTAVSTNTMSVPLTVVFGDKVISGPYVFSTSGRVVSTNAFFTRVGSFVAAAGGTINGGFEDTNQSGGASGPCGAPVCTTFPFTGSYSVGTDGRGTLQFCETVNTSTGCPLGSRAATAVFSIVVASPQQVQLIDLSSSITSTGEMITQDQSVYGARNGNLSGAYSFSFAGVSSTGAAESVVGDFLANGFGTISAGSSAPPTPGEVDINNGGVEAPPALTSGTSYTISSNGRGTVNLGGLNFSIYMVSASQAKFLQIDASSSILTGDAFKQQASAACPWAPNALSGSSVFETEGASSGVAIGDVGSFTASSGTVTGGSVDENNGGTVSSAVASLSGTYTVDPCGRGTLTLGTHSYIFYVISATRAVLQETTPSVVTHGLLVQSQGGPFVNTSLNGSYAFQLSGTNAAGAAGQREDVAGQLTADGKGKVSGGSLDINSFGATQTGVSNTGTYTPDSTPAGTLRATMSLTPTRKLVLYLVSATQFYVLDTDVAGTAIGTLNDQF